MQVLAVDQGDELRVLDVVVPGEADQRFQRLFRGKAVKLQPLLGIADIEVGLLQDGLEKVVLAAEVVVKHAFVGLRPVGDLVDPRATKAVLGEFCLGRLQEPPPCFIGVAHFQFFLQSHLPGIGTVPPRRLPIRYRQAHFSD